MRRFMRILLLLGIMLLVGAVRAQEETEIYIYIAIDEENSELENQLAIILEMSNSVLEPNNYVLVQETNLEDAHLSLNWNRSQNSNFPEDVLRISVLKPNTMPLSSILYPQMDYPANFPIISEWGETNHSYYQLIAHLIAGLAAYSINDCETAQNQLNNTLRLDPYSTDIIAYIRFYLGNCRLLSGNYSLALEEFRAGASSVPPGGYVLYSKHAGVNYLWAALNQNQPLEKFTIMWVAFVFESLPNCGYYAYCMDTIHQIDIYSRRAQLYALAFDYDRAIADMDEAISLAEENEVDNTTLSELYTIRGEIIFLIYEWDRVLENFNHAIELDPNYARAYFQRGVLYYSMSQRENALTDFEYYLELEPDGLYAEEAAQYIESIQIELDALGG